MISGCFLLLVAGLVFFVNNDQSDIGEWRKHSRPGADNDLCATLVDAEPLINALLSRQRAMQYSDAFWKSRAKPLGELRSQSNLGNENQTGLPHRQCILGRLNVDFRLAASGDAVQQKRAEAF